MSSSILFAADAASALVAIGLNILIAYKAFDLGRVLVNPTYRNRALWTGVYGIIAVLFLIESLLYATGTIALQTAYFLRPPGLIALYALLDGSIRTALDQDHFHRNTLYWNTVRNVFGPAIITLAVLDGVLEYLYGFTLEVYPPAFAIVGAVLGYSVIVLALSSNRTPDRPMKRFVFWLAFSAATVVIWIGASSLTSNLTATSPFLPVAIGSFFFLQAARSLAPIGQLERRT